MLIEIRTLREVSVDDITTLFNAAFADYFINVNLSTQQMKEKIISENIDLENSVGASVNNKHIGFILMGINEVDGKKTSYNAGTGVVPEFRGMKITLKMYEYILPGLKEQKIFNHYLEVIDINSHAIHIYKQLGYKVSRNFLCYKGHIKANIVNHDVEIRDVDIDDENLIRAFWNAPPSWQNSFTSIMNLKNQHKITGAYLNNKLSGYMIFSHPKKRIKQFAVNPEFRRLGIAETLFYSCKESIDDEEITIINVDEGDKETIKFIEKRGLSKFIRQLEMVLNNTK